MNAVYTNLQYVYHYKEKETPTKSYKEQEELLILNSL